MIFCNQRLQRWCFDVELLFLAGQLGVPVAEVAVPWTEMPGSKIRLTSILHMASELLTMKVGAAGLDFRAGPRSAGRRAALNPRPWHLTLPRSSCHPAALLLAARALEGVLASRAGANRQVK